VTPAPWVNVLANAGFGTVISESGSAYTWAENAHEFRLTPWHNDPVTDVSGEALYLRDEDSGRFWSPTPLPSGGRNPYTSRHGFGYSVFEHVEDGIDTALWVYVDLVERVKKVLGEQGPNFSSDVRRPAARRTPRQATAYAGQRGAEAQEQSESRSRPSAWHLGGAPQDAGSQPLGGCRFKAGNIAARSQ